MDAVKINAVGSLFVIEQYKRNMPAKKKEEKIEPIESSPATNTSKDFYDDSRGRHIDIYA